jgi:hypothetical protein
MPASHALLHQSGVPVVPTSLPSTPRVLNIKSTVKICAELSGSMGPDRQVGVAEHGKRCLVPAPQQADAPAQRSRTSIVSSRWAIVSSGSTISSGGGRAPEPGTPGAQWAI